MITKEKIRELEEKAKEKGYKEYYLMNNAGYKVYEIIKKEIGIKGKKILVLIGKGNNGGDGLVFARLASYETEITIYNPFKKYSRLAEEQKEMIKKELFKEQEEEIKKEEYDIIIDAIFGIGFQGELPNELKELKEWYNKNKAYKISIDYPSGLTKENQEKKNYFKPDLVITFHDTKPLLNNFKTIIAKIGLEHYET